MQRTNMKNLKTSKLQIYRCIHKKEIEYLQRIGHPFSNYCYVFLQVLDEQVRPNDVWTCVACSYFIYKKLRLLVDLRIFSKFQGA